MGTMSPSLQFLTDGSSSFDQPSVWIVYQSGSDLLHSCRSPSPRTNRPGDLAGGHQTYRHISQRSYLSCTCRQV